MDSLQGHFLVAAPQLGDPNFVRTVVLMVEHTDEGALGLVLNRPTARSVSDLLAEVGGPDFDCPQPVYIGGPVPGPLMSLHTDCSRAEVEVIPGVYLSAKKNHLDELVQENAQPMKIFLGHSGWGPGQLDREMQEGAWLTVAASCPAVFSTDDELWNHVCKQIGDDLLRDTLGIKQFPDDPTVN
jgi:putative transcriptional regulator